MLRLENEISQRHVLTGDLGITVNTADCYNVLIQDVTFDTVMDDVEWMMSLQEIQQFALKTDVKL